MISRLAGCIDRGVTLVAKAQKEIRTYVEEVRAVHATLDTVSHHCAIRQRQFRCLQRRFERYDDPIFKHMSKLMNSFEAGLFAGGGRADLPQDNLDLERWFRLPKGHERRIHGRSHSGTRIVQEGPTLLLALDAHIHHPEPFTQQDLYPYRHVTAPDCQRQAISRRKVMKKARSTKRRPLLLKELEIRYLTAS